MPAAIAIDREFEERVGSAFGEYCGSLEVEGARVDLFRGATVIVAYVDGGDSESPATAVSPYLALLEQFARDDGRRLRLIYT